MLNLKSSHKLRKFGIISLALFMSLGIGLSNAQASHVHSSHWNWRKSLSVKRALHNTSHKKSLTIKDHGNKQRLIKHRVNTLYHDLRQHGFSRKQSVSALMVVDHFHSTFTNHFNAHDRNAGYFDLTGISRSNYIKFAHADHLPINCISSQLTFLVKMFGNPEFISEFKDHRESTTKLAESIEYHLITGTHYKYDDHVLNTVNNNID